MSIFQGLESALGKIGDFFSFFADIFADVDFSVLYSWLPFPSDISAVLVGLTAVILILAAVGLVKKIVVFLG